MTLKPLLALVMLMVGLMAAGLYWGRVPPSLTLEGDNFTIYRNTLHELDGQVVDHPDPLLGTAICSISGTPEQIQETLERCICESGEVVCPKLPIKLLPR